jgi:hypothetical protein
VTTCDPGGGDGTTPDLQEIDAAIVASTIKMIADLLIRKKPSKE